MTVNGTTELDAARRVLPGSDAITVDGEPLPAAQPLRYFALHKPRGVISSAGDDRGRPTVIDYLPEGAGRCVPVGRLDLDSEGLLLLSNDGELIDRLLHPRNALPRSYLAEIEGRPSSADLQRVFDGIPLEDGATGRAKPKRSKRPGRPAGRGSPATSWLLLTLEQGRKREVRQLCAAIGHPVVRLIRVRFGPIRLGDQAVGEIRELSPRELRLLRRGGDA